jgi:pentatricopeptide repeat protein
MTGCSLILCHSDFPASSRDVKSLDRGTAMKALPMFHRFVLMTCALILLLTTDLAQADTHALLIAIDRYDKKSDMPALQVAVKSAQRLSKTLQETRSVPAANIRLLTSEDKEKPTRDNIFAAIDALRQRVKVDDTVFVYYFAHGIQLSGETYLSVYDSRKGDARDIRTSGLSLHGFVNKLQSLLVTNLVVAFETCRTEYETVEKGAQDGLETPLPVAQSQNKLFLADGPRNIALLFSSRPGTPSWEWLPQGWGFLGYYLDQGLRGEAADETGTVRIKNLTAYLEKAVRGAVLREMAFDQRPHFALRGAQCAEMILATKRPPGKGGATAAPTTIGATAEARFRTLFQKGAELYFQDKPQEALTAFQEALAAQPDNAGVLTLIGATYMRMERAKESEKLLRQALEKSPDNVGAIVNLAIVCQVQGKSAEAETLYKRAMKLVPDNADLHFRYASLCINDRQDFQQGERLLRRSLELDSSNGEVWGALGIVYTQNAKKTKEAEECLRRAIALMPEEATYLYYLANLFSEKKQEYDEALPLYRAAVRVSPKGADNQTGLINCLLKLNRLDEAREAAKQAREQGIKLSPELEQLLKSKPMP